MLVSSKMVYFATSNKHKFDEARDVLKDYGIKLKMIKRKVEEIQNDDLKKIAIHALSKALIVDKSMIVEDAGLFIKALNGFPGPYSSYFYRTLGIDGIIKLMSGKDYRDAEFRSMIAFSNSSGKIRTFQGVARGKISMQSRGKLGFGFDPIFIPKSSEKTFAEMSLDEKNKFSHRANALRKFAKWYVKFYK